MTPEDEDVFYWTAKILSNEGLKACIRTWRKEENRERIIKIAERELMSRGEKFIP